MGADQAVALTRGLGGEISSRRVCGLGGEVAGGVVATGAIEDRSLLVKRETENEGGMAGKVAAKGVETNDAGSFHSRRRVLTGGSFDPLQQVRLPE